MEAAAAGVSSKLANRSRQSGPSSSASTLCTVAAGIGGAASCSLVSVARYGAASSSGSAASKTRQRLAELHRAALELAEDLEQLLGGALLRSRRRRPRPARPPTRLPSPTAVRPATPSGSAASLALRGHGAAGEVGHASIVASARPQPQPHAGCGAKTGSRDVVPGRRTTAAQVGASGR